MIVSENNDFNIVAALCSPAFSSLDVQISMTIKATRRDGGLPVS